MDENRRIADYLRSTADLTDYFKMCRQTGNLALVESALRDMPDWATFHEVRSALGAAGLRLGVAPLTSDDKRSTAFVERRKGPRTH
ncbi:hypothetical protein [Lysobacter humi (ex Lee et al. 2017)]